MTDPFSYVVSLKDRTVTYGCGWVAPIIDVFDEDGDYAIDDDEVVLVCAKIPGGFHNIDLRLLYVAVAKQ